MTFHIGSKKRWWNNQRGGSIARLTGAIALMVGAALYEIFSSPFARWWFVALIVGGVVVALVIRMQRGDEL
jgi:multidrug efflux pump subunit AcrB